MRKKPAVIGDDAAVWMTLAELKRWKRNPRTLDPEAAAASLVRFGFASACTAWVSRNMLVAGHSRLAGLELVLTRDPTLTNPEHQKLRRSLCGPTVRHVPVRLCEFESEAERLTHPSLADYSRFLWVV